MKKKRKRMLWKNLWKIGVSGSRKFPNPDIITMYLDRYVRKNFENPRTDVVFITGGAPHLQGVDFAVERYCGARGIMNLICSAAWTELGRVAGPKRNQQIVDLSNEVFCFWNDKVESPGTLGTITKAKRRAKIDPNFKVTIKLPWEVRKELGLDPVPVFKMPSKYRLDAAGVKAKQVRRLIHESGLFKSKRKKRKLRILI